MQLQASRQPVQNRSVRQTRLQHVTAAGAVQPSSFKIMKLTVYMSFPGRAPIAVEFAGRSQQSSVTIRQINAIVGTP